MVILRAGRRGALASPAPPSRLEKWTQAGARIAAKDETPGADGVEDELLLHRAAAEPMQAVLLWREDR